MAIGTDLDVSSSSPTALEESSSQTASSAWPGIYKNMRLWRCDKNNRVAEIFYTPNSEEMKFLGADDYDMVTRTEAAGLMAAKAEALERAGPVRFCIDLTICGAMRSYDYLFMPHKHESGLVDGLICTCVEIPRSERLDDQRSSNGRGSELSAFIQNASVLAAGRTYAVIAGVVLDPTVHGLRGPLGNVALTPTEWLLLDQLLLSKNCVARKESLLLGVWGPGYDNSTGLLHELMSRVRRRFVEAGASHDPIVTIHRVGYLLNMEESLPEGSSDALLLSPAGNRSQP